MKFRYKTAASAISLATTACAASSLPQLWQRNLSNNANEPVTALAFSPDGTQLAVTTSRAHLQLVSISNPQAPIRELIQEGCDYPVTWSPNGKAILICDAVVRLEDGGYCVVLDEQDILFSRNQTWWLNDNQIIRNNRTIFDLHCRPQGKWQIPGNWPTSNKWAVVGSDPQRGWLVMRLAVNRYLNHAMRNLTDYAIAGAKLHTLTSGMLMPPEHYGTDPVVAPGATALCSSVTPDAGYKSALQCWNMPDGSAIRPAPRLTGYTMTQASLSSTRAIAERWGPRWWEWFYEFPELRDYVIFDVRSGKRITLVPARDQPSTLASLRSHYDCVAISPDGNYLAEGGNGTVSLYRLP